MPFMPVYHSKDLVHWEVIGRVLPPSKAGWVSDLPSTGNEYSWKTFFGKVKHITGNHDFFIKFPSCKEGAIIIKSIRFLK
jgi:hypothetical protein